MFKLLNRIAFYGSFFALLILPQYVIAQSFDINPADGQVDAAWDDVPAMVQNQYGYGELVGEKGEWYDIVNSWVVFDSPDPNKVYFRVDGYYILDVVAINFDCDGDLSFSSESDRAITFFLSDGDEEIGGTVEGIIGYTEEYMSETDADELITTLIAQGEFESEEDSNAYFQRIEAVLDVSDQEKTNGDMAACFSRRGSGNWALSYQYDTEDDQTIITSQQVRTAVTMQQQTAFSQTEIGVWVYLWVGLITMTFSLLYWRRKFD